MSLAVSEWPASRVRLRRPTLLWAYALLAPAMIFILTSLDRSYQTDLWHHLARGREIVQTHSIVNNDVFTYTIPSQPLIDNNWLTQVVAYQLYELGGIDLVQTANSLLLAMTVAGVVAIGIRQGTPVRVAALIGVCVVFGLSSTLLIRPQTVSMFLFVVLMAMLLEAEHRRKMLGYIPLLMAIWANVHGAFPIGLLLIGCFTFGACVDSIRRLPLGKRPRPLEMIACFIVSTLATFANPYGVHVYAYVRGTSALAVSRQIQEWLKPDAFTLAGAIWIASLLAMLCLAIFGRRHVRLWAAVVVVAFAAVSCTSVRMSIWWYLTAATIAMTLWPRRIERPERTSFAAFCFAATILAAAVICAPALAALNPVFNYRSNNRPEQNLAELASAIEQHSPGARVFSRLEWGEYLSFALPWKQSIFMDGRIEIYPDTLWTDYRKITTAEPGWENLLMSHGVEVLLLDTHYHDGLIAAASKSPHWRQAETIGGGVIFVRNAEFRMQNAE